MGLAAPKILLPLDGAAVVESGEVADEGVAGTDRGASASLRRSAGAAGACRGLLSPSVDGTADVARLDRQSRSSPAGEAVPLRAGSLVTGVLSFVPLDH